MKRRLRILSLVAVLSVTGCFGQFALVRGLYDFNAGISNGFARTVVLWAMLIVPVYELAALGDFWVLNVVEFWTGENPLEGPGEAGAKVRVSAVSRERVEVTVTLPNGEVDRFELVRAGENSGAVRDSLGRMLSSAEVLEDGSIAVSADGHLRVIRAAEVEALAAQVGSGGLMSAARDLLWGDRIVAQR